MIHWLLQSLDDCPEILRGDSTPAWLSPAERERTFKAEKRRRDWLLGRWTAKNLVQRYLAQTIGESPALERIFIGADADGAPYASCELRGSDVSSAERANYEDRLAVSLSISHSHGTAFCGLVETMGLGDSEIERLGSDTKSPISNLQSPNLSISQSLKHPSLGCDLELIEPREGNFLDNFFTGAEVAAVRALRQRDVAQADILTTAIWSGKEAVLKALREGLRIDTRRITCRFDPFAGPPQDWTPFIVVVDDGLAAQFPGAWSGWWRLHNSYVLTLATLI